MTVHGPHRTARRRRFRSLAGALGAVALLALAGCGAPATTGAVGPTGAPRPQDVQEPAHASPQPPDTSCNPRASLRPSGGLPSAGQMPAGSTMAKIAARGRLIVGVDQTTYLFGYLDSTTGQISGFDIDVANEMATAIFGDASPQHVQYKAISSAQRIPFLQNDTVDIVVDSMTITCERAKSVAFSTDYFDAGQRILVHKGSPIKGPDDLAGKKVCAADGTTSISTIAGLKAKPVPVAVKDWTDCMVLLQQGQIDAVSTDDSILDGLAAQDPTTQIVGPKFTDEPHGIAMGKNNDDLVRFVNGVLDRMRADGGWKAIYTRWLSRVGPTPEPPAAVYTG